MCLIQDVWEQTGLDPSCISGLQEAAAEAGSCRIVAFLRLQVRGGLQEKGLSLLSSCSALTPLTPPSSLL